MLNTIKDFILNEKLIDKDETIVIGLSGGIDSMVLFDVLYKLNYKIVIAHVNHNKRVESDSELLFVKEYTERLNIPFESIKLDKIENTNFEAEARRLRYEFFFDVAKKYKATKIATAHHLDDLLETILMKISRGSNLYGYGGIKPLIAYGNISIIRPLLAVNRKQIEEYQALNNIPFKEDITNKSLDYTRNRYRHKIIPLLVMENDNIYQNILRYSKQMYNAFDYIRKESIKLYSKNNCVINNSEYKALDDAVRLDYLSYTLEQKDIPSSFNKLKEIDLMILSDKPNGIINVSKNYVFVKEYDKSYVKENKKIENYEFIMNIGDEVTLPDGSKVKITTNITKNEDIFLKVCYNTLVLPLKVRNKRDGDYFTFEFGNKKLKDLFIDMKIPSIVRKSVPIILDGNDKIIGIPGIIKGPRDVVNPIYIVYEVNNYDE